MVLYWIFWNLEDIVVVDIEDSMVLSFGLIFFVLLLGVFGLNVGFLVFFFIVFKCFSFIGFIVFLEVFLKLYRKMNEI